MISKTAILLAVTTVWGGLSPTVSAQIPPALIIPTTPKGLTARVLGNHQGITSDFQAIFAQQAEAQQYIDAVNLGQVAYYIAHTSKFAPTMDELGLGIPAETDNYRYQIVFQGNDTRKVIITAQAKDSRLKSYAGAVFIFSIGEAATAISGICETNEPSTSPPAWPTPPLRPTSGVLCPEGAHPLSRFDRIKTF
ncbi:MAG TPA: hypothetical protein DDZ80_19970 [Cyanobacteria bacterium UBA8803]|nr:hypothetical protein [Cyanobacteria bacterium UBA9273]HBL60641.1 hypothetical protein [Cyanobacteria bacterium UBA8803]